MRLVQRTVELHPGESKLVEGNYNGGALLEVAAFGEGDSSIFLDGNVDRDAHFSRAELSTLWLAKLWPKTYAITEDRRVFYVGTHGLYVRLPDSAEHPVLVVLFLMFE